MSEESVKPTKSQLIEMLNQMNEDIEKLPQYALTSPVSHLDFSALLILLYAIHKAEV